MHVADIILIIIIIVAYVCVSARWHQTDFASVTIALQSAPRVRRKHGGPDVLAEIDIEVGAAARGPNLIAEAGEFHPVNTSAAHRGGQTPRGARLHAYPATMKVVTASLHDRFVAVAGELLG